MPKYTILESLKTKHYEKIFCTVECIVICYRLIKSATAGDARAYLRKDKATKTEQNE